MTDSVPFPSGACHAGVSRDDITPPEGIYHRMWGAATQDRSTGIHQPLTSTVLVLAPLKSTLETSELAVWIGIDHCLLWPNEMQELTRFLAERTGLSVDQFTVFFSHTHAAGLMDRERQGFPGGDLIGPYLDQMSEKIAHGVQAARATMTPAWLTAGSGSCRLATNRDYLDRTRDEYVCGFNPRRSADETLLLIRISRLNDGTDLATIVNYACHPTTLAWDNTLISPDYPGTLRSTVEPVTGVPCLFIQGASGDVGPRDGFVGDVRVAERNGAALGHAVLSTWNLLPPPATRFEYQGAVVSGATIGTWQHVTLDDSQMNQAAQWEWLESSVDLPYRDDLPDRETLLAENESWSQREQAALASEDASGARDARAMLERIRRRLTRVETLDNGSHHPYRLRFLRIGDIFCLPLNGEHYNALQTAVRRPFPDAALIIGTLANGSTVWYLPDRDSYGLGLYQESASVLACGSLELLSTAACDLVHSSNRWSKSS